jgi:hypothetical protein
MRSTRSEAGHAGLRAAREARVALPGVGDGHAGDELGADAGKAAAPWLGPARGGPSPCAACRPLSLGPRW